MSARRRSAVATIDPPTTDLVTDPTEALKRRAQERFLSALNTYRRAVFTAAAANGEIPDAELDAVVEACQVAGIPVEQFADDVESVRSRERQLASAAAVEHKRDASAGEAATLANQIVALELELKQKRERQRVVVNYDRVVAESMRHVHDLEARSPWLFLDAASVTPEAVRKKLTTRAYFTR